MDETTNQEIEKEVEKARRARDELVSIISRCNRVFSLNSEDIEDYIGQDVKDALEILTKKDEELREFIERKISGTDLERPYIFYDGHFDDVVSCRPSEVENELIEWVRNGDYNFDEEQPETFFVDAFYSCEETGERGLVKVSVDPPIPPCVYGEEHKWESPHELVGGLRENPGVFGHGGGAIFNEVCLKCETTRITDTWAQDKQDGTQGLHSIKYQLPKRQRASFY